MRHGRWAGSGLNQSWYGGEAEWTRLIDSICAGLEFARDTWDQIEYCGTTWSDSMNKRSRAPRLHWDNLRILKDRVEKPDKYNEFIRQQPSFEACEVLSETSTVPPADDDEGKPEEIAMFEELTNAAWNWGLRASIPEIAKKATPAWAQGSSNMNSNLGKRGGQNQEGNPHERGSSAHFQVDGHCVPFRGHQALLGPRRASPCHVGLP